MFTLGHLLGLIAVSGKPWCDPSPGGNYSLPIRGVQCNGMIAAKGVDSPSSCAAHCCADSTCNTWLFGTAAPGGCWTSPSKCVGAANPGWSGASKFPTPNPPPPPPPLPPPPPPNGVRLLLYASPDCTGVGTPDMSYKLGSCSPLEPFPHTRHDAGVKVTAGQAGISGSNFSIATWASSRTCDGQPSSTAPIVLDACANVTHGSPAGGPEGMKWVRAWVP
jgi:hypothetical protein